jgi:uracil-DNA glycosylase
MSTVFGKYDELKILNNRIKECSHCRLSSIRTQAVCGEGNVNARFFFIAQAPGEMEDKAGKMFIGPTGKVFDELFFETGLNRNEVYMTNLVKCRLPGNRKPKADEIELCGKYLEQEIEIVKPKLLIPLGYHATKYILDRYCTENRFLSDFIGKLIHCNEQNIYPLRHPSALLYNPSLKYTMLPDFKRLSVL